MNVWLVVPPRPRADILNLLPPYALGYLAAALRRKGHTSEIIDAARLGWDVPRLVEATRRAKPAVVGITVFSSDVPLVAQLAAALKRLQPSPWVILGGIHPTCLPEATLARIPEADFVFRGEAENGLPDLVSGLQGQGKLAADFLAQVPGLAWRDKKKVHLNAQDFPGDLDALGSPAWDLMPPSHYQRYPPTLFVRQRPFAPIITSRGCPYLCTFCTGHAVGGRKVRERSLDLVFKEIGELRERFGIREIHIEDDHFTHSSTRVEAFCEGLIQRRWDLAWTMPNGVRLDTLDLPLLRLMRRAGCYLLIVGAESGSDRILKSMQKKITASLIGEKTALISRAGILPHAFFMLGYPGETEEDREQTLALARRLPLVGAHFSSYRPLPGTTAYQELLRLGEISEPEYAARQGTLASVVYAPRGTTPGAIKAWQRRMLLGFYLRPRILAFYFLEMLRHPGLVMNFLKRAWRYLQK